MRLRRPLTCVGSWMMILALAVGAIAMRAGTINSVWNGGTGNWSVPTDWTPNGVPNNVGGNVYNVTIDSGGFDLVSLDINATIASLVLGGTTGSSTLQNLSGTAETLEVTGATTINGNGNLTFGNASTLKFDGGLTALGSVNINGGTTATITGNLSNSGQFNTGSLGGSNTVNVSGAFTNNAGALLQLESSGDVVNVGSLANSGTVSIASGTTLNLTNEPNGITDVPAGSTLTVAGTLSAGSANGLGQLASVEGNLTLENGQTTSDTPTGGTLSVSSAGAMTVTGGTTFSLTGNVNNSGSFSTGSSGGTNTVNVSGTFTNNAGALLQLESSGDVVNVGSLANSGTVSIASGTTLNLTNQPNGITDVPAGSTLTVAGTLKAGSANGLGQLASVEGNLTLENGQTTSDTPTGGTLSVSSAGAMTVTGGTTFSLTGNVNNSGSFSTVYSGGASPTVNISGAFTNNAGASLQVGGGVNVGSLSNSGTAVVGGTLNLTNQPNGITDIVAGSSLTVVGSLTAGSANGLANLTSVEGTLALNNCITNVVTPTGGTLTISSAGSLEVGGYADLSVIGNVNNSGQFNLGEALPGGLSVSGTFTNNAGAVLTMGGTGTGTGNINAFTNNGDLYVNGFIAGYGTSSLTVTGPAGSFTNVSSTGAFSGGSYFLGGTFDYTGHGVTDLTDGTTLIILPGRAMNVGSTGSALTELTSVEGTLHLNGLQMSNTVTPVGGTLTISPTGDLELTHEAGGGATLSVTGNVNNLGLFATGIAGGKNTVNVSGYFVNNAGASLGLHSSSDVANVNALTNNGTLSLATGSRLSVTGPSGSFSNVSSTGVFSGGTYILGGRLHYIGHGVTDLTSGTSGTSLTVNPGGALNVGSSGSALTGLTSVEGTLDLNNGLSNSVTPSGGTLTVSKTGDLELSNGAASNTTLSVAGKVNNSGSFATGFSGGSNTVNVSGTFTNNAGATLQLESSTDVVNVAALTNAGTVNVSTNGSNGAVLDLTASGTLTNSGAINLGTGRGGGTLKISGSSVSLSGKGTLTLSNNANNLIVGATAADTLTNVNNAIQGGGNIGGGQMGFVNEGTVLADQGTPLIIYPSSTGFNNKGTLSVDRGATLEITGPAGSFFNYNSSTSTLTGGTYLVSGKLQFGVAGNTITTDAAMITLNGSGAKIIDPSGGNIIAPLATISAGRLFDITGGYNFTTQGNFTNNGTLTVGSSNSTFHVNGNLTNFNSTTKTLKGGTFNITGTLRFNGANIVTNAANITLTGTASKILNQTGGNGLANFATNASGGVFSLKGGRTLTTAGAFSNAGTLLIGSGSAFTVGGTGVFTQTGGKTTDDGTLTDSGGLHLNGGSLFGKGTISGAVTSSATITPGDSTKATGILTDKGAYTQKSTGTLDISIDGTAAGTQYDQLDPTTANLNGTLNINRPTGFVPKIGSTFKILNFKSETGKFSTVTGLAINSSEHFTIAYQGTDVLLTVASGAAPTFGQFQRSGMVGPAYSVAEPGRFGFGGVGETPLAPVRGRPRGAPLHGVISAWELASTDSGIRRNALNRPAARRWPTLQSSGERVLWAAGRMAAFAPARNWSGGVAPYRFISAGANGAVINRINPAGANRINPAGALLSHNAHTPRMLAPNRLEYHLDLLSILSTSPRRALRDIMRPPGSPDAGSFGYLTFSGNR